MYIAAKAFGRLVFILAVGDTHSECVSKAKRHAEYSEPYIVISNKMTQEQNIAQVESLGLDGIDSQNILSNLIMGGLIAMGLEDVQDSFKNN